jgi:hypothetical protein
MIFRKRYISEKKFQSNLINQLQMTPMTLSEIAKYNKNSKAKMKIEVFFYSKSKKFANKMASELRKKGYSLDVKKVINNKGEYLINGWTSEMDISKKEMLSWTKEMCELGYLYNCDFDGWGTNDF